MLMTPRVTDLTRLRERHRQHAKSCLRRASIALAGALLFAEMVSGQQPAGPAPLPPTPMPPPAAVQVGPAAQPSSALPGPTFSTPRRSVRTAFDELTPSAATQTKINDLISDVIEAEAPLSVDPRQSKLIRTKRPVSRFSVTHPDVLEVVQFGPTEFELIGGREGETSLTLWFDGDGGQVLRYYVRVEQNTRLEDQQEIEYGDLAKKINELFPNSMIQLIPVADKLIVRGQARDSEEASEILAIIRGQATDQSGAQLGPYSGFGGFGNVVAGGVAARPRPGATDLPASSVISLLDVPGERQVMLKVRIAEISRTAARSLGTDLFVNAGDFALVSPFGLPGGAFSAILSTDEVLLTMDALSSNGYSKMLAEPNLVTLSGQPAYFIAGGEFAVPTVVGVEGAAAATTAFRGFGTQVAFTPTIIDKDRFRLKVAPSFSTINSDNTVNGIPGLNSRSVVTTVDLREGQWLAIAGLIQDQQAGTKVRTPLLGDIPIVDTLFSKKEMKREETELIVLVSPELVKPLEVEQTPLVLPGMDVTEPNDWAFFLFGFIEGNPDCHHRSTVIPNFRRDIWYARHQAVREVKMEKRFQKSEAHYVHGPHGFSE
jgi:pilus assembly protein CpaC